MTVPAQHCGTFTADELDEIAAQREALDATDYHAFKRYPVPPLEHCAITTRAPHPYTSRILRMPTL